MKINNWQLYYNKLRPAVPAIRGRAGISRCTLPAQEFRFGDVKTGWVKIEVDYSDE